MTTDQVNRAYKSSHDECQGNCIHAEATSPVIDKHIKDCFQSGLEMCHKLGLTQPEEVFQEMMLTAYYHGLHVGYRLHQVEMEDMGVKA